MIMRFRPANIRLINRRSKLLRLLLALSSGKESNDNDKTTPLLSRVDTVTPYQANSLIERSYKANHFREGRLSGVIFAAVSR